MNEHIDATLGHVLSDSLRLAKPPLYPIHYAPNVWYSQVHGESGTELGILYLSLSLPLSFLSLSIQFNSIQGALLARETYVNVAKASEVDNIQKLNKL